MDLPSYRELYYRWEHEQWSAGEVDLEVDRSQWASDLSEGLKRSLLWQLSSFCVADERVTAALVPYIDAAPTEEQQVFLSTQLADTARHLVFFDRFLDEVVDEPGDTSTRIGNQSGRLTEESRTLLLQLLPDAAARIRHGSDTLEELVRGIVLQHLVIEGTIASTGRHFLTEFLGSASLLPGVRQGLKMIERDAWRHVGFGLRFLTETVAQDDRFAEVVRSSLTGNPVGWSVLRPPDDDGSYLEPFPYSLEDLTSAAQRSLDEHLRTIGVDLAA